MKIAVENHFPKSPRPSEYKLLTDGSVQNLWPISYQFQTNYLCARFGFWKSFRLEGEKKKVILM